MRANYFPDTNVLLDYLPTHSEWYEDANRIINATNNGLVGFLLESVELEFAGITADDKIKDSMISVNRAVIEASGSLSTPDIF